MSTDHTKPSWIPGPQETVVFQSVLWCVVHVDMGGKCTLRPARVNNRGKKRQVAGVDIALLSPLS